MTEPENANIESLVEGRSKRSTAGRHMSALLDAEADDDLALLFEEIEDDNEFDYEGEGDEDDMGMDSSSDDEDQGPNVQDDDEGEKELQKEAVSERKKRRAQEDLRIKTFRKKVKLDAPAPAAGAGLEQAPRPKKKSERISWLPTVEEGPTRSSSRRQTMQNKEVTHAKLKDSEEKRIRLIATMDAAAKRKAQFKPKEMTQAERLAEAERVERHNSKSLNRWELMEKRKAEDRKAKIEALQNRRLEGPVMSYWSGIATWTDGRLTRVGKVDIRPKPEKEENVRKKSKKGDKEDKDKGATEKTAAENNETATSQGPQAQAQASQTPQAPPKDVSESGPRPVTSGEAAAQNQDHADTKNPSNNPANQAPTTENAAGDNLKTVPEGSAAPTEIPAASSAAQSSTPANTSTEPASDPTPTEDIPKKKKPETEATDPTEAQKEPTEDKPQEAPEDSATAAKPEDKPKSDLQVNEQNVDSKEAAESTKAPDTTTTTTSPAATAAAGTGGTPVQATQPGSPAKTQDAIQQEAAPDVMDIDKPDIDKPEGENLLQNLPQELPPAPAVIEQTGRSLTILENFDDKTAHSREFNIYFNAKKPPRLTKISSSLCVITSLPSRYRDPVTSLPFANAYAHKEIHRTASQRSSWSPMLGCYVGPTGVAARGVPARFLGGEKEVDEGDNEAGKETNEGNKGEDKAATGGAGVTTATEMEVDKT